MSHGDAWSIDLCEGSDLLSSNTPDVPAVQYERLIEPHRERLRRYAYRLTRNTSEAEDFVQETMLRAYTRLHLLRGDGSVGAWLSMILLNVFRNQYRRLDVLSRAHRSRAISLESVMPGEDRGHTRSAEECVLYAERHAAALTALAELPDSYREVILLFDVRGESYQAIADHLRVPVGTVRSRIHRGRKRLRTRLDAWRHDGG